jgi:hypothetical protein
LKFVKGSAVAGIRDVIGEVARKSGGLGGDSGGLGVSWGRPRYCPRIRPIARGLGGVRESARESGLLRAACRGSVNLPANPAEVFRNIRPRGGIRNRRMAADILIAIVGMAPIGIGRHG